MLRWLLLLLWLLVATRAQVLRKEAEARADCARCRALAPLRADAPACLARCAAEHASGVLSCEALCEVLAAQDGAAHPCAASGVCRYTRETLREELGLREEVLHMQHHRDEL